jgi:prepilin-type N-terminal cleavage/methylation domain-containing protein
VRKFLKSFRYGQRGFTLIELLIVVAILGILAAILIPNVTGFLKTANLAAANSEAATVKTACTAYYADDGTFPVTDSNASFYPVTGTKYLDKPSKSTYAFNEVGIISGATGGWAATPYSFFFWTSDQQWHKTASS